LFFFLSPFFVFISFGAMGLKWTTIPEKTRKLLEREFSSRMQSGSLSFETDLSFFLQDSQQMGYSWNENPTIKEVIFKEITSYYRNTGMTQQDRSGGNCRHFVNIIQGLGLAGVKWVSLPMETRDSLLMGMGQYFKVIKTRQRMDILMHG
jgi:hypothetical protein